MADPTSPLPVTGSTGGRDGVARMDVVAVQTGAQPGARTRGDALAVEAPLEIRMAGTSTITMRTPGADAELAVGFLFSEGIVRDRADVLGVDLPEPDAVQVALSAEAVERALQRERRFTVTSACGACGKASIEQALALDLPFPPPPRDRPLLAPALAASLPDRLRAAQPTFAETGGLHAAGLFDAQGALLLAREDVGRHNAVDKVVGARLLAGQLPASSEVLAVSGRASFELVQKAILAGIPVLAAVGAPSTLAVQLAARHDLTLLGFVRDGRFNVYAGAGRIDLPRRTGEA
jgi:FdhD protein